MSSDRVEFGNRLLPLINEFQKRIQAEFGSDKHVLMLILEDAKGSFAVHPFDDGEELHILEQTLDKAREIRRREGS
jgi:hypothetical protein